MAYKRSTLISRRHPSTSVQYGRGMFSAFGDMAAGLAAGSGATPAPDAVTGADPSANPADVATGADSIGAALKNAYASTVGTLLGNGAKTTTITGTGGQSSLMTYVALGGVGYLAYRMFFGKKRG